MAGYRIDGVLGEGGMGTVYRATQLSLNRVVALKLLAAELSDDPGFRARFRREGELQAGLDHQHIVTIHEAGQTDKGLFLAMRLIAGPTLKDLILSDQLDPRRTLRILAQVAQALDAAHEAGLTHRDVKPQNILVDHNDHAYLADFGLTKAPDDAAGLTSTGQFVGTTDYTAPEQIRGERASAASDCYSLAAVLYECLTGLVPFPRASEISALQAHLLDPPPRVTEIRPDLSVSIDDVVARGMAKDPSSRPATATDLIREATRAYASAPRAAVPTIEPEAQATRLARPLRAKDAGQATRVPPATAASPVESTNLAGAYDLTRAGHPTSSDAQRVTRAAPETHPSASPARDVAGRRTRVFGTIVLVLAAGVVAAGFVVGRSGSGTSAPNPTSSASAGYIQLRFASPWQLGAATLAVPGLSFAGAAVNLRDSLSQGGLTAGEVSNAGGPSLLSPSLRASVQGKLPPAVPVRLGGLEAYRYTVVRVRGLADALTLYVVPTSTGVATIVCSAPAATATALERDCAQVAATLRIVGTRVYPLGPTADYASRLSAVFARLRAGVSAPLAQLRVAPSPSAQAKAARLLAAVYTTAAGEISRAAGSPLVSDANRAIAAALGQLAQGYSGAASAAGAAASSRYARARQQIAGGSAALRAALQRLSALGYSVGA